MKPSPASCCLGALVVAIAVFLIHLPQTRDPILFDDAADYMRAAHAPMLATWLNTDSITPLELLRRRGAEAEFAAHPWFSLYVQGDNAALRHFHTPVTVYLLHIVRLFFSTDRCARVLWSVAGALLCGLLYYILARSQVPLPLAALIALFAGLQASFIEVSVDPTPHAFYLVFAFLFLYLFSRYLSGHGSSSLYLAAVALALAAATLEFSLELVLTVPLAVAVLWLIRREILPARAAAWKQGWKACAVFFAATFVLWPGGWLRGGYLECYGILSASVLQRNHGKQHTHQLANRVFSNAYSGHMAVWILAGAAIAAAAWLLPRKRLSVPSIVFSCCAIFALGLGVADHFILNTFFFESVVIPMAAAGLVLGDLLSSLAANRNTPGVPGWLRPALTGILCLLLAAGAALECRPHLRETSWGTRPWLGAVLAGIRAEVPPGATVMAANNREAFSLYLPEYRLVFAPDYHTPAEEIVQLTSSAALWIPGGDHYGICIPREYIPAGAEILGAYPAAGNWEFLWRLRAPLPTPSSSSAAGIQ